MLDDELRRGTFTVGPNLKKKGFKHHEKDIYGVRLRIHICEKP
jgi:hypothetical protein